MAYPGTNLTTGTSEVEVSAASQESGYTTMAALSSAVDNMSMTIPRKSQSSSGGEFAFVTFYVSMYDW